MILFLILLTFYSLNSWEKGFTIFNYALNKMHLNRSSIINKDLQWNLTNEVLKKVVRKENEKYMIME